MIKNIKPLQKTIFMTLFTFLMSFALFVTCFLLLHFLMISLIPIAIVIVVFIFVLKYVYKKQNILINNYYMFGFVSHALLGIFFYFLFAYPTKNRFYAPCISPLVNYFWPLTLVCIFLLIFYLIKNKNKNQCLNCLVVTLWFLPLLGFFVEYVILSLDLIDQLNHELLNFEVAIHPAGNAFPPSCPSR